MADMKSDDNDAAVELASDAGAALMKVRSDAPGDPALGKTGDELSHVLLTSALEARFPEDRIRSEEAEREEVIDDPTGRVWIIDPLDGTREFSEGREDWAVHVALAIDGEPKVGAVALPAMGLVLNSGSPPPLPSPDAVPRIVVSRTRPPEFVPVVAEHLGAVTVPMGSAGAKISAVIRGEAEIYVHAGGQYEWDSAAPVAVALAAGLHASRLDGSPLVYAQPDPWLPDLMVCHPSLVTAVREALAAAGVAKSG
jgi:3'(2'), 5'-bisphosphate nucleotidase